MENNHRWTNRDWKWLVGILIGFIILILTFRLGDNLEVINLFSFISSSVSIALAGVAIFIALKQDSDNQRITSRITNALTKIETKVDSMDGKIDNLDPNYITRPIQDNLIKEIQEIFNDQHGEQTENSSKIDEIVKTVNEKFNSINYNLKSYYDRERNQSEHQYKIMISVPDDEVEIKKFIDEFTLAFNIRLMKYNIQSTILKITYIGDQLISIETLERILNKYNDFYLIDVGLDGN